MRFIVRRFTSFFPEMSFCPASFRELKTVSFILWIKRAKLPMVNRPNTVYIYDDEPVA